MATNSYNRAEVARILDLSPAAVDALIENGGLLCRLQQGEPRVPSEVLEAFLRDSLIRLYQSEAAARAPLPVIHEPAPQPAIRTSEPPQTELEDDRDFVTREPETVTPLPLLPLALDPPVEPESGEDRPDLRAAPRYVPRRQIDGIFGDTKFTLLQISRTGLRIRHRGSLLPGDEMKLSFALLAPARSVVVKARVVWTSLAKGANETFSISGVRIIEHADRLERAIDSLLESHDLEPERRVQERRGSAVTWMPDGVTDDEMAAVLAAVQRFASDPIEANRWYSRARFALADERVRREAPQRPRDREEILGLWEFLERRIEIPKIVGVVTWMRRAKAV